MGLTVSNPSKAKGTAAESAVVKFARANGFPLADRLTLSGRYDRGDIQMCRGLVVEVKAWAGYSDGNVMCWLGDTEQERINAGADHAFLVIKRNGKGAAQVGHWWAVELEDVDGMPRPVYRYLVDHLARLRQAGWGDPSCTP